MSDLRGPARTLPTGAACGVCKRPGTADTDAQMSGHGWAVCPEHADRPDPVFPEDPTPAPLSVPEQTPAPGGTRQPREGDTMSTRYNPAEHDPAVTDDPEVTTTAPAGVDTTVTSTPPSSPPARPEAGDDQDDEESDEDDDE